MTKGIRSYFGLENWQKFLLFWWNTSFYFLLWRSRQ